MEELTIPHFRSLLDNHVNVLKDFCKEWEEICTDDIPNEVAAEIRTTIGLTNLLLNQKLKQFSGLIDDSEHHTGEKEVNCGDLQGFWDMVYHEIEKIQKSFKKLETCRTNSWVFVEEQTNKPEIKKKTPIVNPKIVTAAKAHAVAARQRLAEAKLKMKAQLAAKKLEGNAEEASIQNNPVKESIAKDPKMDSKTEVIEEDKTKDVLKDRKNMQIPNEKVQEIERVKKTKTPKSTKKAQDEIKGSPSKKQKVEKKASKSEKKTSKGRKNALGVVDENKPEISPSRKEESDFIPLQCVTRSASKRALLEKNATNRK